MAVGLSLDGTREQGQDVRTANVMACVAVSNIVKSSLGPVGLDKMLVDQVGDVTVTNDGATILKLLEVEHPAAKILTELAQQQDDEVGDGTFPPTHTLPFGPHPFKNHQHPFPLQLNTNELSKLQQSKDVHARDNLTDA